MLLAVGALARAAPPAQEPPPPVPPEPPARLSAGAAIERDLAPGELHRYRLDPPGAGVAAWWIGVEQRGIDVAVRLLDTDGSTLLSIDSPNGSWGLEPLLVESVPAEGLLVEVAAPSGDPAPGAYTLTLEPRSDGTEAERSLLAAERATTAAALRLAAGTPEGAREAVTLEGEAIAGFAALGRAREQADVLEVVGFVERTGGHWPEAVAALEQEAPLWHALGEPRREARALNDLGFCHWSRGEADAAIALYQRALPLWGEADDLHGRGLTLNNLALAYHAQGRPREALPIYQEALELFRRTGDAQRVALVINNLGGVADVLGEPAEAAARYQEALDACRALGDREGEARALNNLAVLARGLGRFQETLDRYDRLLVMQQEMGDRRGEARTLNNLGETYQAIGDQAAAERHLEEALPLRREVEDRRGEATTLHNLAQTLAYRGDLRGAVARFEEALAIDRETGDRRQQALTLVPLGADLAQLGEPAPAEADLAEARRLLADVGDARSEGEALRTSAQVALDAGHAGEAYRWLLAAVERARATRSRPLEARSLSLLAAAAAKLGREGEAYRHALAALDVVESLRAGLGSLSLRATYFAREQDAYEQAVGYALALHARDPAGGFDRAAFAIAERARARSLLELLAEAGAEVEHGVDPALEARQRELTDRLEAKGERQSVLLARHPERTAEAAALAGEIDSLRVEREQLEAEIRRSSPAYAALSQPRPLEVAAAQALLGDDTLLLAYSLGAERSTLWAVGGHDFAAYELPPRATIEAAAQRVYDGWRRRDPAARGDDAAAARALSDLVLAPAAARFGDRRLVVVADGVLQLIPFAALPDPVPASGGSASGAPLVARHEVVNLPSASVLAVERAQLAGRPPARGEVAVIADPVFAVDDPRVAAAVGGTKAAEAATRGGDAAPVAYGRLFWSRSEASAIAALADPARTLVALDFQASLDTVEGGRLRDYRFVHFATHGVIDGATPALSGLVLSQVDRQGRARPGFLRLAEVYDLELRADLVTLSGCDTALGKQVRGEGLVGLTRGFLYAGAAAVAASLWQVQDRSTAALMERFYRGLLAGGERPAAALRQAQLAMLAEPRWRDPYYWAGFVLYGDWK
jgi:CHAT domain-containing protein